MVDLLWTSNHGASFNDIGDVILVFVLHIVIEESFNFMKRF